MDSIISLSRILNQILEVFSGCVKPIVKAYRQIESLIIKEKTAKFLVYPYCE